jgi:hypothetical protein
VNTHFGAGKPTLASHPVIGGRRAAIPDHAGPRRAYGGSGFVPHDGQPGAETTVGRAVRTRPRRRVPPLRGFVIGDTISLRRRKSSTTGLARPPTTAFWNALTGRDASVNRHWEALGADIHQEPFPCPAECLRRPSTRSTEQWWEGHSTPPGSPDVHGKQELKDGYDPGWRYALPEVAPSSSGLLCFRARWNRKVIAT